MFHYPWWLTYKCLASCPTILFPDIEILVHRLGVTPGSTTIIPLNWKLRLFPDCLGLLMSLSKQAKKRFKVLAGVIDPYYQGKLDYYSSLVERKNVFECQNTLGQLLQLSCTVIKVNGKIQPNPSRMTNSMEPSEINVWVTPWDTEPRFAEVLAEGQGTVVWITEKCSYAS